MTANPDTARVRKFFDSVASEWDSMRLAWYDERVIEELHRKTRAHPTSTIVDIGTGTGFVACGLAPRVARVVAVDSSPAMLEVARANLAALAIRNVELLEADIAHLPLPDDSVDAAVANMVLHHVEEPEVVLKEMARVTRPSGRVAITDAESHRFDFMRREHADIWLGFERAQVDDFFRTAHIHDVGYAQLGFQ